MSLNKIIVLINEQKCCINELKQNNCIKILNKIIALNNDQNNCIN